MKSITISAETVTSTVGVVVSYSICVWLFWYSQRSGNYFNINPSQSLFYELLRHIMSLPASRWTSIVVAFLSINLCWVYRYMIGSWICGWALLPNKPAVSAPSFSVHESSEESIPLTTESEQQETMNTISTK